MKNIFKFMGIALMACSLTMVSCNKDKDDDTNTPDTPADGSYTLNVNNENHNWGYVDAKAYESQGQWAMSAFQAAVSMSNEEVVFPYFVCPFLAGRNNQTGESLMAPSAFYQNANYAVELFYESMLQGSDGNPMGDYQIDDIPNYNFGSFDATNHTITCNYSFVFYNYMEWQYALTAALEAAGYTVQDWNTQGAIEDAQRQSIYNTADAETTKIPVEFALNNYAFAVQAQ